MAHVTTVAPPGPSAIEKPHKSVEAVRGNSLLASQFARRYCGDAHSATSSMRTVKNLILGLVKTDRITDARPLSNSAASERHKCGMRYDITRLSSMSAFG